MKLLLLHSHHVALHLETDYRITVANEHSDLIQNIGTLDLDLLEDLSGFLTLVGVEGHYSQPQPPTEGGEHDDENEAAFP